MLCLHLCAKFHNCTIHNHENINKNETCNKAWYAVYIHHEIQLIMPLLQKGAYTFAQHCIFILRLTQNRDTLQNRSERVGGTWEEIGEEFCGSLKANPLIYKEPEKCLCYHFNCSHNRWVKTSGQVSNLRLATKFLT